MYSQAEISRVREAVDIVRVIGDYVRLQRSSKDYKGLCPFHQEKTPSFVVHPEGQYYKCFGCDARGNVFRFLIEYEGISFPEAVRTLAARSGVPLTELTAEQRQAYAAAKPALDALPIDDWWHEYSRRVSELRLACISICNQLWPDCPTAGFVRRRRWLDRVLAATLTERRWLYIQSMKTDPHWTARLVREGHEDLENKRSLTAGVVTNLTRARVPSINLDDYPDHVARQAIADEWWAWEDDERLAKLEALR